MSTIYYLPTMLDPNKTGPLLEHIYQVKNAGVNQIKILTCGGSLKSCSLNQLEDPLVCKSCIKSFTKSAKQMSILKDVEIIYIEDLISKDEITFPDFSELLSIADWQRLTWDDGNFDLGWALISTYVSRTRDMEQQISHEGITTLVRNAKDAIIVYEAARNFLNNQIVNKVVLFNGRLFDTRALLRICQKFSVECSVVEIGGYGLRNLIEFENTLPHDIVSYTSKVKELWRLSDDAVKVSAHDYFRLKKLGKATNNRSFTENQSLQTLPVDFDKKLTNIVIFNSSEDEIFSIGPEWKKCFGSQAEGIRAICDVLKDRNDYHVYLRIHPNLKNVKGRIVNELHNIASDFSNITIIRSESKISSYGLLMVADKVITFGSTMGVEATYFDKPSLVLSDCFYSQLDCAYTWHEVDWKAFLLKHYPPKPKENSLKYALYQMKAGRPFQLWDGNKSVGGEGWSGQTLFEKILRRIHGFTRQK